MIDDFIVLDWQNFGIFGIFLSGFLAASVLPANSEIVFLAYVSQYPHQLWIAWFAASLGNSLGGVTSFWLGRIFPQKAIFSPKVGAFLQQFGAMSLFFSWLPIVGDGLCVAAGWFRLSFWRCFLFLALGKSLRYALLALPFWL